MEKSIAKRGTKFWAAYEIPLPLHEHKTRNHGNLFEDSRSRNYPGNLAKDSSIMEKFQKFWGKYTPLYRRFARSRLDCLRYFFSPTYK
jgi:hypothetical protein